MPCIYFGPQVGQLIKGGCCGSKEVSYSALHSCLSPEQSAIYAIPEQGRTAVMSVIVDGVTSAQNVALCEGCQFRRATVDEAKPPPKIEKPSAPPSPIVDERGVITVIRNPDVPGEPMIIERTILARNPLPPIDPDAPYKPNAQRAWEELRRNRNREIPFATPVHPAWDSMYCVHRQTMTRSINIGNATVKVLGCNIHGECTVTTQIGGLRTCAQCNDKTQQIRTGRVMFDVRDLPDPRIEPKWVKRLPIHTDLIVLNNSITEHNGQLWMAYRNRWNNAELRICRLTEKFEVKSNSLIDIPRCKWNSIGCEDPRLFVYAGKLHVAFTGVENRQAGLVAHIMYARLNDDAGVEQSFLPHFASRQDWEKNWSFFEHDGRLFCEYSFNPRVILEVDDDTARLASFTDRGIPAVVGSVRGGASPVLVGNEWYVFHHHVFRYLNESWYGIGLHTFENKPPFGLRRIAPHVLMLPVPKDRPANHIPHVVYPAGAVLRNGQWIVSYGYYDRWCQLVAFDAEQVNGLLTNA